MKITKSRLKQIIKEELQSVMMGQEPVKDGPEYYYNSLIKLGFAAKLPDPLPGEKGIQYTWKKLIKTLIRLLKNLSQVYIVKVVKYTPNIDARCYNKKIHRHKEFNQVESLSVAAGDLEWAEAEEQSVWVASSWRHIIGLFKKTIKDVTRGINTREELPLYIKAMEYKEECVKKASGDL